MSIKKVKIFSDFCDPQGNLGALKSWGKGLTYKDIEFVCGDDFTHAILINNATPNINVFYKNIINFLWEPYELLDMHKIINRNNGGYFVTHDGRITGNRVIQGIPFLPPLPLYENYLKPKKHLMSIIASSKNYLPGHMLRHQIVNRILKSNLDIHIYGNGIENIFGKTDSRIKGKIEDKTLALSEYKYSIAIENSKYDYYLTEKFTDPIICGSIPIYWGANCVNNVYGDESHINLSGNNPDEVFSQIENIYNNNIEKDTNIAYQKIINSINFPHFVWSTFN